MITYQTIIKRSTEGNPPPPRRDERTPQQWQEVLPADVFSVTRMHATEAPMSSNLCTLFEPGVYACACCGTELFDSGSKFESGTGWPSFSEPVEDTVVAYHADESRGMSRIEIVCAVCDAHLGHVFPDGPRPTGLRFCVNGLALTKVRSA